MKKGVLFDFWGTLVDNKIKPSPTRQAKDILDIKRPFHEYIVPFEEAFMTEDVEDLYEAFRNVCEELNIEPEQDKLDKLVGMWNKSNIMSEPYPETFDVLEELQDAGYKLGLISNTPPSIHRVLEKFDMEKYFDAMVFSFEAGYLKTNPKFFQQALDELGLDKDEVIMVGDSLHSDMAGAENAGVMGVLIDRRGNREYKNKISNLTEVKEYLEG